MPRYFRICHLVQSKIFLVLKFPHSKYDWSVLRPLQTSSHIQTLNQLGLLSSCPNYVNSLSAGGKHHY